MLIISLWQMVLVYEGVPCAHVERPSVLCDIDALVDRGDEVVDDLHEELGVAAEVQALLRRRVDIPVEILQRLVLGRFDHIEDEVEAYAALALRLGVFVRAQLHHLEVVQIGLLLRVFDLYVDFLAGRLEHVLLKLIDVAQIDQSGQVLLLLLGKLVLHQLPAQVALLLCELLVDGLN